MGYGLNVALYPRKINIHHLKVRDETMTRVNRTAG